MSRGLAKKLMEANSAEAFLSARPGGAGWRAFASLKLEVDRLVHIDLDAARSLVERIEQAAALTEDSTSVSFAQASRATLLNALGNHSEANQLYESSAQVLRSAKLHTHAAILQKQQVYALTYMGSYDEALRVARDARRALANAAPVQMGQLEANIGNIYYRLDRYKKALTHYDRAHEILSVVGDKSMQAVVDFSRSSVFTDTDRPDEALALLQGAAKAWDRAGWRLLAAQARFHIAYLQFLRGNYNTALAGYYHARDRLTELGSAPLVAFCNLEIAEILLALNAFDDAVESATAAEQEFKKLGMPYEFGQAMLVRALAEIGLGQSEQSREDLEQCRAVFSQAHNATLTAVVDSYMAELAIRRGDADEAESRARLALKAFSRQKLVSKSAHARLLVARAFYSKGEMVSARRWATSALRTVEQRYAPAIVYMCHHLIGRVERAGGKNRLALDSFRRAVETVERMRGGVVADEFKATFLSDKIEVYEDAIRACLDESSDSSIEEAFRLVEAAKSRGLADLLASYLREAQPRRRTRRTGESATRARLLKLIEELNWHSSHANLEDEKGGQRRAQAADRYSREIARCERQIGQLFRRLEAEGSPVDSAERLRAVTPSELQDTLEPGETAIEYFTTGDEISAFVVTRSGVEVVRAFASKRDVEQTLAPLKFQIEKFNYGPGYAEGYFEQLNQAANQYLGLLYRELFAPVERFAGHHRLIVIPHGALHYVPFHALLNRRGYLIDQFEISYSPSATVLKLCREMAKHSKTLHLNSQMSEDRMNLVALGLAGHDTPEVATEIKALASMFPGTVKLTGVRATRDNLMRAAPDATYLHLASHGYFRRDNPMFSFLKLADVNLNFYSLLDLKLNAEMVTLSACHTGVNKVFPGDELHGLMRGFLHAGAPSLVASLWATSDASTAELMKQMYSQISAGASKRAALRSAQLAVKDDYGHPYYWAPFILMGNPN